MHINIKAASFAQDLGTIPHLSQNIYSLIEVMVALDCGGDDITLPHELLTNLDFISPNVSELVNCMNFLGNRALETHTRL